jgi:hypothetical protein
VTKIDSIAVDLSPEIGILVTQVGVLGLQLGIVL